NWQERAAAQGQDEATPNFDIPPFLLHSVTLYYTDCVRFVQKLYQEGGWDAVNAAYENPPGTTEQILDIKKYKAGEWATEPKPSGLEGKLIGWSEVDGGQFGQYDIYNFLGALTGDYSV